MHNLRIIFQILLTGELSFRFLRQNYFPDFLKLKELFSRFLKLKKYFPDSLNVKNYLPDFLNFRIILLTDFYFPDSVSLLIIFKIF